MRKSLYIEILNTMYVKGIGFETEITRCFDTYSLEADSIFELQKTTREAKVNEYLKILELEGHLTKPKVKLKKYEEDKVKRWIMGEFQIHATLTPKGHVFYDSYLVNENSRQNINFQKYIAITTIAISIGAIIISLNKDKKDIPMKLNLQPLYKRIEVLEQNQNSIKILKKNPAPSVKDSLHKP